MAEGSAPRAASRRGVATCGAGLAASLALLPLACGPAIAAEKPVALKPGDGRDLVASRCASCHSLDYVLINAPFLGAEQWKTSVTKMRTFGAPLSDEEAATIVAYLAQAYGRG